MRGTPTKIDGPPPARPRRNLTVAAGLLVHLLLATRMYGQPLEELRYGPDISVTLGSTAVGAGVLATDDLSGGVTVLAIPNLPATASISAAQRFANGDLLLAFDSTISLPGAGIVEPRDLVEFTSATQMYSVAAQGAVVGIPNGARIDAVAVTSADMVLLSLDVSVGAFDDRTSCASTATAWRCFWTSRRSASTRRSTWTGSMSRRAGPPVSTCPSMAAARSTRCRSTMRISPSTI